MRTKGLFWAFCLLFLMGNVRGWALDEEIRFNHLGVADGLSSNEITCMLKDQKGFFWIGTTEGLDRFDGHEFKRYRREAPDSIFVEEGVSNLLETADGKIWITYHDWRIGLYEPDADRFVPIAEIMDSLRQTEMPARLFMDNQRQLYFSTYNGGFFRYEPRQGRVVRYALETGEQGVAAMGDAGDRLYVAHFSGRIEGIDKASGRSVFQDDYLKPFTNGLPIYMFADSDGELWIYLEPGHHDGLFRLDPRSGRWRHYTTSSPTALSSPIVRDIKEDAKGNIWIATDHGGINILDKKQETIQIIRNNPFDKTSLSQNSVVCLYRDDTGILWAGTYKNGISYYHESIFKFKTVRYPLLQTLDASNNDFNCVVEDRAGDLWVGTTGNGLLRYNRKSGDYTRYRAGRESENKISGDVVISMTQDARGDLWIGSYMDGLTHYDGKRFTHYRHREEQGADGLSGNSVYSLYADKSDRLWIGTLDSGLDCLDRSTGKWSHYRMDDEPERSLNANIVYSLTGDARGTIYVGTAAGVNIIDPESGCVSRFEGTRDGRVPFRARTIHTLFCDSRQLLWIGTNQGLHIYDQVNDRLYTLNRSTGLPDNNIVSILEDDYHTLWIGTKNGLLNVVPVREPNREYRFNWDSYDESEGVQGRVFNTNSAVRLASGELAFGGTNGLSFVDPSHIRYNSYAPSVVLSEFAINNEPVKTGKTYEGQVILRKDIAYTDKLTLPYDARNFSFKMASHGYCLPLKNRYAFKMEGFDSEWTTVNASGRHVTYTNLNPGHYTLTLKARNNDGVWSKEITRLEITILPPFWATGWAITGYVIAGLLLAYWLMRYILSVQKRRLHREQERAMTRKQHELDEMKLRFFTNVSHEFRTPLTLILTPVEKLIKSERNPETLQVLQLIQRNADRLLKLVNQLLDFRKIDVQGDSLVLSAGNIVPFVRDIVASFKEISVQKQIQLTFTSAFSSLPMKFDTDKMYKIIVNLLSNAFKFTPEGGKIGLTLSVRVDEADKNQLWIEVSDSGIGIPADQREAIFERFYQVVSDDKRQQVSGSGIGLHLCREYVRMHGGSISVKSVPGAGSTFTVTIPVVPVDQPKALPTEGETVNEPIFPAHEPEKTGNEPVSDGSRPTLLLVDDNPDFLAFMRLTLSAQYHLLTASNGEEAWKIIPEALPDMVISDVMMPVTDGITLCRRIKEDIRTSHIPVILLTAKSAKESQLTGLEAGADDYIGKPFNMDMLLLKIRHLVELRKRMQRAFTQSPEKGIPLAEVQISSLDEELMRKAIAYIEEQIANPELTVERLSREMGMSRVNFYKKCSSLTGKTPVELIRLIRLKRAAQLLEKSQLRVSEVALQCGFNDMKLFRKYFKEEFGVLPSDYPR